MHPVRSRLRAIVVGATSAALILSLAAGPTSAAGGVWFVGTPGTNPPPSTLGPYAMTPFGPDGYALEQMVSTVPAPTGGSVGISKPVAVVNPQVVAGGWTVGYSGHVYSARFDAGPQVLSLPGGTKAFYLYAEPDVIGGPYTVTAWTNNGTSSGPIAIGPVGATLVARYFGFYVTSPNTWITTITVSNTSPYSTIIGEFGIYRERPSDAPLITGFSPMSGRVGQTVTITGTNFGYANSVTFNGRAAPVSVRNSNTIVTSVPAGATTGKIRVSSPFGSSTSSLTFYVMP
jgi:hypothetical protein